MRCAVLSVLVIASVFFVMMPAVLGATFGDCDPNQVIFKMSSTVNAHAATAATSDPTYGVKVCYDDFFTTTGTASGSGTVLKLSGPSNAHVAQPSDTTYTTAVTFGDLQCQIKTDPKDCYNILASGKHGSVIASLYRPTNSHIALGNYYGNFLCCVSPTHNAICVPDTHCNAPGGETYYNCPSDCPRTCNNNHAQDDGESGIDCGNGVCSVCAVVPLNCGNGVLNSNEACDGNKFPASQDSCKEVISSKPNGNLKCKADCTIDTSSCSAGTSNPNSKSCIAAGTDGIAISVCRDYDKHLSIADASGAYGCECEPQSSAVAQFDATTTPGMNPSGAFCKWDGVHCNLATNPTGDRGGSSTPGCKVVYSGETSCGENDRFRKISYYYEPYAGGSCASMPTCTVGAPCDKEIPCPQLVTLPFFGMGAMIASALVICVVYMMSGLFHRQR